MFEPSEKQEKMIEIPEFNVDKSLRWQGLVIHHSATPDGKLNDWEGIRKYHKSWRLNGEILDPLKGEKMLRDKVAGVQAPWRDIGYHFGIERDNGVLLVKLGRAFSMAGAHAVGFNHTHLGLCIVGDFDKAAPDDETWQAAKVLVSNIKKVFNFANDQIFGHRETFEIRKVPIEKSCPGAKFDLLKFRQEL